MQKLNIAGQTLDKCTKKYSILNYASTSEYCQGCRPHVQKKAELGFMSNVINLSDYSLSDIELQVLEKGLSFVPTRTHDKFNTHVELYKFLRKLKINFGKSTQDVVDLSVVRRPSTWVPPPNTDPLITAYEKVVLSKVNDLYHTKSKVFHNTTRKQKEALEGLRNNNSIIIKPADKGGAIVVQNRNSYISEVLRQLNNTEFYEKIFDDPTSGLQHRIDTLLYIGSQAGYLTSKELSFLTVTHPITG